MLEPLLDSPIFRRLFAAQVLALIGTGLMTVALALLAFELAPDRAGTVLGTALAIKMIAYVGVSPFAGLVVARFGRKRVMIAADLARMAMIGLMPFVSQVWQIYVLIFVLQSASAVFTPTFQATIADLFDNEENYTKALVLSRLAFDLEALVSPLIAAVLLSSVSFSLLFVGTSFGFACSALLVASAAVPWRYDVAGRDWRRATLGVRLFKQTPRLNGIMLMNVVIAAAGSMILVNTVVYVQGFLGGTEQQTALAFALAGAGSLVAAIALQPLLNQFSDRTIMLAGAALQTLALFIGIFSPPFFGLLAIWLIAGFGGGLSLTPVGRVLRRSAAEADREAVFAAQFGLSHLAWMFTYPLAGWLGTSIGMSGSFLVLTAICSLALIAALVIWPTKDEPALDHVHNDLPPDHPHLTGAVRTPDGFRHAHTFVIDALHHRWPR